MTEDAVPTVVLDTNVALDWLVFGNPGVAPLVAALASGSLRRIACARMRDELAHVLGRGLARQHGCVAQQVLARWDEQVVTVPEPSLGAAARLVCSDRDDQVFIDLAQSQGARWLFTRDRALLKLARRARAFGTTVTVPERWAESTGP
jgi:predicted nucleic acid-binding protein